MNITSRSSFATRSGAALLTLATLLAPFGRLFASEESTVRADVEALRLLEEQTFPNYDAEAIAALEREKSKPDVEKDGYFANPKLVALFAAYEIDVCDGERRVAIPFRLHAPETIREGERYPLIVVWHGTGESDDDNASQLSHLQYGIRSFYEPRALDAFIVAAQCPRGGRGWSSPENRYGIEPIEYSVAIIRALEERFPIDSSRVSALGICSGAAAAIDAERRYPGLFCAMALCSYAANEYETEELAIPVWAFGSVDDDSTPINELRRMIKRLRRRGVTARLTENRNGHDSWTNALGAAQVLAWLGRQTGKPTAPPPGVTLYADRTTREIICQYVAPFAVLVALFVLVEPRVRRRFRELDERAYFSKSQSGSAASGSP